MTLDEAVAILNREKHRDADDWKACTHQPSGERYTYGVPVHSSKPLDLTEFEAIAIAEKYLREEERELPR